MGLKFITIWLPVQKIRIHLILKLKWYQKVPESVSFIKRDWKSIWFFSTNLLQDVSRLYKEEQKLIQVSLIEGKQILASFTERLQKYAEKKIRSRKQMELIQANVTGIQVIRRNWVTDKLFDFRYPCPSAVSGGMLTPKRKWLKKILVCIRILKSTAITPN